MAWGCGQQQHCPCRQHARANAEPQGASATCPHVHQPPQWLHCREQDRIGRSSAPRGSLHKDPLPVPLRPRFHGDPLGARDMPLLCSPITRTSQPWGHRQQGVTCCSWWFDVLAFLGAALCTSPLWLCTGLTGCVVSNPCHPRPPHCLGWGFGWSL